jgi:hypothetical protein
MRKLPGVLGIAILIFGVLAVFGGRVLVEWRHEAGGILFWAGLVMTLAGWITFSMARNKTCSYCQARIKAEAHQCERCSTIFG